MHSHISGINSPRMEKRTGTKTPQHQPRPLPLLIIEQAFLNCSVPPMTDITLELAKLHILTGADYIRQLRLIVTFKEFCPIEDGIFSALGEGDDDFQALMIAARKAVAHGYKVFILPNPQGIRTADFIFERKGVYKMFDLKTIQGQSSARNRLCESIGQANHVILNLATNYDPRLLAKDIQIYFEVNKGAREVLVFKGSKILSVSRQFVEGRDYYKMFIKRFLK